MYVCRRAGGYASEKIRLLTIDVSLHEPTRLPVCLCQVAAALAEVVGNATLVHGLRDKELPAIALQLAGVKDAAKRDNAPRDMDNLFHSRITVLEVATNDMQAELKLLNVGLEGKGPKDRRGVGVEMHFEGIHGTCVQG